MFDKAVISECKDVAIQQAHKDFLMEIPHQLHKVYSNVVYYYLTEKGVEWVDIINEQLKKRLKEK